MKFAGISSTWCVTNAIGADPISRDAYILFKVIYFAVLGFSVTMLVTLLALAEAGNVAIPGRSGRRLREQTPP